MSKKQPSAANQDYYKVAGRAQRPNEHEFEEQKREVHQEKAHQPGPPPTMAPKAGKPGKKDK